MLLGLDKVDDYLAFCFDEAAFHFGTHCEAEMSRAESKAKTDAQRTAARVSTLERLLHQDEGTTTEGGSVKKGKTGFRDPASMLTKG